MSGVEPDIIRELLDYNPETGKLFWKHRDIRFFEASGNKTAEQVCRWWNNRFAGKDAFTATGVYNCRAGRIFGRPQYAHRVAWVIVHGEWPTHQIDHINGDRADNRLSNLRAVDHATNMLNKRIYASNKSGEPGVTLNKRTGRWESHYRLNSRRVHIGTFTRLDDAIAARRAATAGLYHANHGRAA